MTVLSLEESNQARRDQQALRGQKSAVGHNALDLFKTVVHPGKYRMHCDEGYVTSLDFNDISRKVSLWWYGQKRMITALHPEDTNKRVDIVLSVDYQGNFKSLSKGSVKSASNDLVEMLKID